MPFFAVTGINSKPALASIESRAQVQQIEAQVPNAILNQLRAAANNEQLPKSFQRCIKVKQNSLLPVINSLSGVTLFMYGHAQPGVTAVYRDLRYRRILSRSYRPWLDSPSK